MNGAQPITLQRRTSRRRDRPSQRPQARSDVTIHAPADRVRNTRSVAASTSRCRLCLTRRAYPKFTSNLQPENPCKRGLRRRVTEMPTRGRDIRSSPSLLKQDRAIGRGRPIAAPRQRLTDTRIVQPERECDAGHLNAQSLAQRDAGLHRAGAAFVVSWEGSGISKTQKKHVFVILDSPSTRQSKVKHLRIESP